MNEFLSHGPFVDWDHPEIQEFLTASGWRDLPPADAAEQAYKFVRDEVGHSFDVCDPRVTMSASSALRHRVGLCYSKSHLLAAFLRGLGIPAAIRYQRLRLKEGFCLHSFNSIWLEGQWRDVDARGNNEVVAAGFSGPLAFVPDASVGEITYPDYYVEPVSVVEEAYAGATDVFATRLPDEIRP